MNGEYTRHPSPEAEAVAQASVLEPSWAGGAIRILFTNNRTAESQQPQIRRGGGGRWGALALPTPFRQNAQRDTSNNQDFVSLQVFFMFLFLSGHGLAPYNNVGSALSLSPFAVVL